MTQGAKANESGQNGEKKVQDIFDKYDLPVYKNKDIQNNPNLLDNVDRYVIAQEPYMSIYNMEQYKIDKENNPNTKIKKYKRSKMDFKYYDKKSEKYKNGMFVEVKNQNKAGSVDEKIPYITENFNENAYGTNNGYIVLQGNGFKAGVKKWAQEKCEEINNNNPDSDLRAGDCDDFDNFMKEIICN